jgi:hypothetical protein
MEIISTDISMSNPLLEEDLRTYVKSVINSAPSFRHWPKDLLLEVEDVVSKEAKGMYEVAPQSCLEFI